MTFLLLGIDAEAAAFDLRYISVLRNVNFTSVVSGEHLTHYCLLLDIRKSIFLIEMNTEENQLCEQKS